MNRAVRRHPTPTKPPKRGAVRPLSRPTTRAAPARPARRGLLGILWPRWLADIVAELRKVVWPPPQEAIYLTMVVVIVAAVLGGILGAIDIGFGWFLERILLR
ncbi:MAG: preprotein translocase subunit SecE [Dehalococcoidia bacterium]